MLYILLFKLQILSAIASNKNLKLIFLCSPGNPTGKKLNDTDVIRVIEAFHGLVIVDEAYIDFSLGIAKINSEETDGEFSNPLSFTKYLNWYPNLAVSQTLSKSFGMAGVRLGILVSSIDVAVILSKIKAPYSISQPTCDVVMKMLGKNEIVNMKKGIIGIISSFYFQIFCTREITS